MLTVLHPWHGVDPGPGQPRIVNAVIEIPEGSRAKYEIDKASGLLKMDRVIHSSFHYPMNYGFIPQTLGDDKDPLDILVLSAISVQPLCIVEAKVIGVMQMVDSGDADDKIIAIANTDPSVNYINNVEEMPQHFFNELRHFFEEYKKLENKTVIVEEFQDKATALKSLQMHWLFMLKPTRNNIIQNPRAMTLQDILILVLIGLAAGTLGGMVGIGGGIIVVPALIFFMGFSQHQASGTSLAMMLPPVGILAVINYYKKGALDVRYAALLAVGFLLGGYLGSKLSLGMAQDTVKKIFAVVMIVMAVKMLFFDKK
jgi:inorganic pyrophosphatase